MRSKSLTRGQKTALTCVIAGVICEAALFVMLQRPPSAVPLGVGLGSGGFVWIDRNADEYPSWFGVTLTVCASIGVLISLVLGAA